MLRELSKLEVETETKLSMKELAQKFENLAHGEPISTDPILVLPVTRNDYHLVDIFYFNLLLKDKSLFFSRRKEFSWIDGSTYWSIENELVILHESLTFHFLNGNCLDLSAPVHPPRQMSSARATGATRAAPSPCWSGSLPFGAVPPASKWAWLLIAACFSVTMECRYDYYCMCKTNHKPQWWHHQKLLNQCRVPSSL